MTRWRIEETIRFMKQSYQLEDVRLLRYTRLQNLMVLLTAVLYFTAVDLGIRIKLRVLSKTGGPRGGIVPRLPALRAGRRH